MCGLGSGPSHSRSAATGENRVAHDLHLHAPLGAQAAGLRLLNGEFPVRKTRFAAVGELSCAFAVEADAVDLVAA